MNVFYSWVFREFSLKVTDIHIPFRFTYCQQNWRANCNSPQCNVCIQFLIIIICIIYFTCRNQVKLFRCTQGIHNYLRTLIGDDRKIDSSKQTYLENLRENWFQLLLIIRVLDDLIHWSRWHLIIVGYYFLREECLGRWDIGVAFPSSYWKVLLACNWINVFNTTCYTYLYQLYLE